MCSGNKSVGVPFLSSERALALRSFPDAPSYLGGAVQTVAYLRQLTPANQIDLRWCHTGIFVRQPARALTSAPSTSSEGFPGITSTSHAVEGADERDARRS